MKLAKTWNGNEAGVLWECYYLYDDVRGYHSYSYGPGFDNPIQKYESEKEMWEAYRAKKQEFNGTRYPKQLKKKEK